MEHYDDHALKQYLLGLLPETQREAFDELSIIDDEFAARLEAVENGLIDAYIWGEMEEPELAQFESQYLASPHQREKVKFAQALQSFAKKKLQENPAGPVAESVPWWRPVLTLFTVPRLTLPWGFAALALLLVVVGGWLVLSQRSQVDQAQAERAALRQREKELQAQLEQRRSADSEREKELERVREQLARLEQQALEQQRAKLQPSSLPAELNVVPFDLAPLARNVERRAPGGGVTLTIPPGTDYVTLRLKLDAADYPAYRAELRTESDDQEKWNVVWRSGRLKAKGENKAVDVSIRADKLKTRAYTLTLKGIAGDGSEPDAPSYAFRVVRR